MKSTTRIALCLPLLAVGLAACGNGDKEKPAEGFDPRYDGVSPNSLTVTVDRSILDPQQAPQRSAPVASAKPTTAPAGAAPPPEGTAPGAPTTSTITPEGTPATPTPDAATGTPPATSATPATAPGGAIQPPPE